jgi:sortase (surface protein transpeptidase)
VVATSTPQGGQASEIPLVASTTRVPPVTTLPQPTQQDGDRPPSRPSKQTTADAEPSHPAVAGTMAAAAPVRLQIPSIGMDSELIDLGLQADGTLEVPPSGFPAGWYTGAPTPGELGPAIIAGHVDWGGQPGVFFDLRELSTGDEIAITRQDGSTARFRVTQVEQFAKNAFPTQAVYGDLDHAGLRLITCGGSFDRQLRSYVDNLVVFAELVGGDSADAADSGPGNS